MAAQTASTPATVASPFPATPFVSPPFQPPTSTTGPVPNPDPYTSSNPNLPESRHRRLWELRLLHNYTQAIETARQPDTFPPITFDWAREIPALAFQDDAMLYTILAQSALNLWVLAKDPRERDTMHVLQSTYLGYALREQRDAITGLTRATADRVCMASLLLLRHAFALVQTTIHDEHGAWAPPLEWLRIGRGTGRVWTVARSLLAGPTSSSDANPAGAASSSVSTARIQAFINTPPNFDMDEIFAPANRAGYLWLLENPDPRDDPDDDDAEASDKVTMRVYENALSYTGWTALAVERGEAEYATQRRLAAFAVWMPDLLEEFCQQRRLRALVVLAWFFRLWIPFSHRWEVSGVGERMIKGIYGVLEEKWRVKLDGIMAEFGL